MTISVTVRDLSIGGAPWQAALPDPVATIGRSATSDLVLQDPDKHVSRLHATIERRGDNYWLIVNSKINPILVDGEPRQPGTTVMLRNGANVGMHPFELVVSIEAGAPMPAFAPAPPMPASIPAFPPAPPMQAPMPAFPTAAPARLPDNYNWLDDAPIPGAQNPFAPGAASQAAAQSNPFLPSAAPSIAPSNPFGREAPSTGLVMGMPGPLDGHLGSAQVLDPLALLGGTAPAPSFGAMLGPAGAPLIDFGGPARGPATSGIDHVHDFNLPFGAAPASPPSAAAPTGTVALDAFLHGLGNSGIRIPPGEETAFFDKAGGVVQAAVEGLVTLLLARGEIKKELRAEERTMLASRANNPLKFMGSAEEAVRFLFDPAAANAGAFLSPQKAIEDACTELVAHELGLVAGMRAAVIGAIRRFEPQALERNAGKVGASLIPMGRKAKLWDSYVEQYEKIELEMADNLDRLFERDFLTAYTDQVRRMSKK
ncbi:type VI secretion system-associated FHA domain protein TagH [Massilia sp. R2A-15]|uniref:type VI secretion system-associated FHA domain protein TagH n=1 Tax=Massilia sp. R2A-15 TaxID=3064278 RepID=UPI0027362E90|nr:type VI secretion system-associated FHA domain protein TagH [Massilia sp. R2A-15]WLI89475.1 type VI secretion system-associated FHA domain protein TagH [Massilia sp. R2A-15]